MNSLVLCEDLLHIFSFCASSGPPGPPRNLRVTDVTSITLTITWDVPKSDGSSDVAQYFIEMKEEQALDFVPVGRVDGRTNSFTSEFMQRGKQYRFRVKAKNSAGFSEPADLQDLVQLSQAVGNYIFQFVEIK